MELVLLPVLLLVIRPLALGSLLLVVVVLVVVFGVDDELVRQEPQE